MTAGAGRVRRLLAARDLSRDDAGTRDAVAPYGALARRRSGIDDRRRRRRSRLGEPWIDGDDVYWLEGRPAEGGRRVARPGRAPTASTADLTPAPFNVRTRVHEYGGGSYVVAGGTVVFSRLRRRPAVPARPGRRRRRSPITPDGPVALRGPARSTSRAAGSYAVREDHGGERPRPVNDDRRRSRSTAREPTRPRHGPGLRRRRRACRPTATRLAWLEWDHPDMPWDATGCGSRRSAEDGTLGDVRRSPPAARTSRSSSRSGRPTATLHFVSDRTGWWNLYRLVDGPRLEPLAADGGRVRRPGLDLRPLVVRVPRRRRDRRGRPAGRPRPPLPDRSRAARRRGRRRRSPSSTACRSAPADGRRDRRRATEAPTRRRAFDPATLAPAGRPAPVELGRARPGDHRRPRADRVPDDRRPDRPRALLPADEPGVRRARRRAAAARRAVARRPDRRTRRPRSTSASQLLTSRGHRGRRRRLRRQHRLRPRVPATRSTAQWGIVDVDDCVAAARFLVERGDVDPDRLAIEGGSAGGYTTLAALAFRDVFAAGISLFGDRRPRAARARHAQVRVALHGPAGRAVPGGRGASTASARRSTSSTEIACPVLVLQGLDDRVVPPAQAEAIVAALAANGIPHAYLAFEGEGHGFRGADAIRADARGRAVVPRRRSSGSRRPTTSSRSTLPGLDAWRERRAGHRLTARPPPGRPPSRLMDASARSNWSCCLLVVAIGARLRRAPDRRRLPDPARPRRPGRSGFARLAPDSRRSSSSPTSSSCSSCRRSCSAPATSPRSATSRPTLRPIGLLAIGLVLFTTVVVGARRPGRSSRSSPWRAGVRPRRDRRAAGRRGRDGRSSAGSASRAGSSRSSRARASINDASALIAVPRRGRRGDRPGRSRSLEAGVSFVVVGLGGIARRGRRRRRS